eukprot:SAG25_NODE_7078_length_507_cov_0.911765_1_plen_37_part_10
MDTPGSRARGAVASASSTSRPAAALITTAPPAFAAPG